MMEALLAGPGGSWSPTSILAGMGSLADRPADWAADVDGNMAGAGAPGGAAQAFERALSEELLRAGDLGPLAADFELQNGAFLSKAGERLLSSGRADHADAAGSTRADAADEMDAAGPYRRVGFDGDAASPRLTAGGGDDVDPAFDAGDMAAFWAGDRVATHPAFRADGSSIVGEPIRVDDVTGPMAAGRVFFNGDGRPIVLHAVEAHDLEPPALNETTADGDQMILPNGAVLAYDPWTANVDFELVH